MMRSLGPDRQAVIGALTWAVWAAAIRPSWASCLLMLSPLVLVPLGLGVAARREAGPVSPALERLRMLVTPAAVVAAFAFAADHGALSATLTAPWLGVCLAVGLVGIARTLSRRRLDPTVGVDAGLMFLAVGAGWLTISRAGGNPLGFGDVIVELTAVHFHYAGFALPIVGGLSAARTRRGALVPVWVAVAVPLTAVGITAGGAVEWVAATAMATGGLATAVLVAGTVESSRGGARGLLAVAALALGGGMALALGWAWSIRFGWAFLDLDQMARWHGTLNALCFGLAALTGLHLSPTDGERDEHVAVHLGRPSRTTLAAIAASAARFEPTNPVGLLHGPVPAGFRRDQWVGALPHGFEPACEALRRWTGHGAAGITVLDPPPIRAGATVTMAIPAGPISVSATARIVEVVDQPDRYGFTYATLPHHPEDGEESFVVTRDTDGTARYTVTAVWRTGTLASRVLPALTRYLQRRAIGRYLSGLAAARPGSVSETTG